MSSDWVVNLAYIVGGAGLAKVPWDQVSIGKTIPTLVASAIISNLILDQMVTIMVQYSLNPFGSAGTATMFFYWLFDAITTVCASAAYFIRCTDLAADKRVQRLLAINLIPVGLYLLVDLLGIYSTISHDINGKGTVFTIGYSLNALLVLSNVMFHIFFITLIQRRAANGQVGVLIIALPIASGLFLVAASLEIVIQALNDNIISSGKLWLAWNLDLLFFLFVNQAISSSTAIEAVSDDTATIDEGVYRSLDNEFGIDSSSSIVQVKTRVSK